jgi:hypothetical protein
MSLIIQVHLPLISLRRHKQPFSKPLVPSLPKEKPNKPSLLLSLKTQGQSSLLACLFVFEHALSAWKLESTFSRSSKEYKRDSLYIRIKETTKPVSKAENIHDYKRGIYLFTTACRNIEEFESSDIYKADRHIYSKAKTLQKPIRYKPY